MTGAMRLIVREDASAATVPRPGRARPGCGPAATPTPVGSGAATALSSSTTTDPKVIAGEMANASDRAGTS
jgi:hypothetical protein